MANLDVSLSPPRRWSAWLPAHTRPSWRSCLLASCFISHTLSNGFVVFCPWFRASHPTSPSNFFYVTSLYPFDFILLSPFFLYCSCTILYNYFSLINIPLLSSWSFNCLHICFHICPCIRLSSPPSLYLCVIFVWMTRPLFFCNFYKIYWTCIFNIIHNIKIEHMYISIQYTHLHTLAYSMCTTW